MKCISLVSLTLACSFALVTQVTAQSINVDIDNAFGTPSPALAAAGQAGTWNAVPATSMGTALVDLAGAATGASIARTMGAGGPFGFNNAATTGDDEALLDDAQDPSPAGQWTISGLTAGNYTVYTYGWAPDTSTFRTGVSINGGPITAVGGVFAGSYVVGLTHAVDTVTIPASGSIVIHLTAVMSFATFNGVQIVKNPITPAPYCFGDGSGTTCPCSPGAPFNGCSNSSSMAGAHLAASGVNSIAVDTLTLSGSGMPPTSTCLYFQGTTQTSGTFGDGLSCAGGNQMRIGTKTNVGGASSYPGATDMSVSIRGGAIAGSVLNYQILYRDAVNFCTPQTFNLSNGVHVVWAP